MYFTSRAVTRLNASAICCIDNSSPASENVLLVHSPGTSNASAANSPTSSAPIICKFVVGLNGCWSCPFRIDSPNPLCQFSMKKTGRTIVYCKPLDGRCSSTLALLSK
jgi:hypothetical protein